MPIGHAEHSLQYACKTLSGRHVAGCADRSGLRALLFVSDSGVHTGRLVLVIAPCRFRHRGGMDRLWLWLGSDGLRRLLDICEPARFWQHARPDGVAGDQLVLCFSGTFLSGGRLVMSALSLDITQCTGLFNLAGVGQKLDFYRLPLAEYRLLTSPLESTGRIGARNRRIWADISHRLVRKLVATGHAEGIQNTGISAFQPDMDGCRHAENHSLEPT